MVTFRHCAGETFGRLLTKKFRQGCHTCILGVQRDVYKNFCLCLEKKQYLFLNFGHWVKFYLDFYRTIFSSFFGSALYVSRGTFWDKLFFLGKKKFFESRILNEFLEDLLWEIFLWGFKNYAKFPQKLFGLKFLSDIFFQRCRTSDETFFIFRRKNIRQSCQDCILCLQSNISSKNVFFWENIGFLSFRQGMNFLWLFPATFPMGFWKLYATFSEVFFGQISFGHFLENLSDTGRHVFRFLQKKSSTVVTTTFYV